MPRPEDKAPGSDFTSHRRTREDGHSWRAQIPGRGVIRRQTRRRYGAELLHGAVAASRRDEIAVTAAWRSTSRSSRSSTETSATAPRKSVNAPTHLLLLQAALERDQRRMLPNVPGYADMSKERAAIHHGRPKTGRFTCYNPSPWPAALCHAVVMFTRLPAGSRAPGVPPQQPAERVHPGHRLQATACAAAVSNARVMSPQAAPIRTVGPH